MESDHGQKELNITEIQQISKNKVSKVKLANKLWKQLLLIILIELSCVILIKSFL